MQLCLLYTNITFCKGILVHLGGISVNSGGISVNQGYFGNSMYRKMAHMTLLFTIFHSKKLDLRWSLLICIPYTILLLIEQNNTLMKCVLYSDVVLISRSKCSFNSFVAFCVVDLPAGMTSNGKSRTGKIGNWFVHSMLISILIPNYCTLSYSFQMI